MADLFTTRRVNARTGEAEIIEKSTGMATSAYPSSATVNDKHLVLSNWFRSAVVVLDLETFAPVAEIGGLNTPHDALEQDDGSLLIAETGANRLILMSPKGDLVRVVAENLGAPIGLVQIDADTLYMTEAQAGTVALPSAPESGGRLRAGSCSPRAWL